MIRGLVSVASVGVLFGCGAGTAGEAVRPNAPTANDALEEGRSVQACGTGFSEPLVVDMKSNERSDLEVAMKDGVAVVSYDCKTLKVLKGCSALGEYTFAGVTRKEDVVRMHGKDELEANLPLSSATLGGSMKRGSTLDLALVTIGKQRASANEITKADLTGSCDGATHVVRGTYVGAFALSTGTEGEVRAVAQIFSLGAKGSSSSDKSTSTKDGDLEACRKVTGDATAAPAECRSLTRLELLPLVAAKKTSSGPPSHEVNEMTCPPGSQWDGLKCAFAKSTAQACGRWTSAAACRASCDAGNGESCFNLVAYPESGRGKVIPLSPSKMDLAPLDKACSLGFVAGCTYAGARAASKDPKEANAGRGYIAKACKLGNGYSCRQIAEWYDPDMPEIPGGAKSLDKVFEYTKRACDLGHAASCGKLGDMHRDGKGAKRDGALAIAAYERQCSSGGYVDGDGCHAIGEMYANGKGVSADPVKALGYYERACNLHRTQSCSAGVRVLKGSDPAKARSLLERGCSKDIAGWDECLQLGDAYEKGALGLQKDATKAAEAYEWGCAKGGCAKAGDLYSKGGPNLAKNPDKAIEAYGKGCTRTNDAKACSSLEAALKSKGKPALVEFYTKRCAIDAIACVKLKKAGGAPDPAQWNFHAGQAEKACKENKDGDACKLWKDLGGTPTAAELKQPSLAKATAASQKL